MLELVLEHLYASEILVFSDAVHVPCKCSIQGWNMSVRLCADVGTFAATSWCNSENFFLGFLVYRFPTTVLYYEICLNDFLKSKLLCVTFDRSASMYLLIVC
jgi:hypothetical protein